MQGDVERQLIASLFTAFSSRIRVDENGFLTMASPSWEPITALPILRSLQPGAAAAAGEEVYNRLRSFITEADQQRLRVAGLDLMPAEGLHFVLGEDGLYYDLINTDRSLTELVRAGAQIKGNILDFGCSTGRNVATIVRARLPGVSVFGADPVPSSIEWNRQNIPGAEFIMSQQEPPLPYDDGTFDLIYAKSIWTHFSPSAARLWLEELARVLKPGGYFFFTIHGPHDVANRLIFDFPRPRYANIANGEFPDKPSFLNAVVRNLRNEGHFFRPYTSAQSQSDLGKLEGATTEDWGMMFMTPEYLQKVVLPPPLSLIRFTPAATAGRLDGCVVRKKPSTGRLSRIFRAAKGRVLR